MDLTSEVISIIIKIGSKGEIWLPKKVRTILNLRPSDMIELKVNIRQQELRIKKIPKIEELLQQPLKTPPQTPEEIETELEEIQDEMMNLAIEDLE